MILNSEVNNYDNLKTAQINVSRQGLRGLVAWKLALRKAFEGDFHNKLIHGHGCYLLALYKVFEGEWKDRKIISEIAKTFSEGIITYGQYDGSGFNGLGIKIFEKEKQIYLGYLEWGLRRELVLNFVKVMNGMIK